MDLYVIIIVTLIISAFFSGIETAFITSGKYRTEPGVQSGTLSERIRARFSKAPSNFINTLLLGNGITLVVYSMAMALLLNAVFTQHFPLLKDQPFLLLTIQIVVSAAIFLVVAGFIPKTFFRINPGRMIKIFSVPMLVIYRLLFPFKYLFETVATLILKYVFRVRFSNEMCSFSRADIGNHASGYLQREDEKQDKAVEIQMIQNTMAFRNVKVRECMVPRNEIAAVEENDSIAELKSKFIATGHSKVLVYRQSIDNIIGYVHSYDMFGRPDTVRSVIKPIFIIPETMHAHDLLKRFPQERKSVAVVVDEFGGTSGIITTEDLIEEIVGEIEDEFDTGRLIEKKINEQEFILSARHEIDYLNEKYKFHLPESDDYETLAGLILHYHESIPARNEKIRIGDLEITILQASHTRIELIKLHLPD